MMSKKVAELLLSIKAMTFRFDPPYVYTTGLKSPVYLDNRLVMSYPRVRKRIVDYYIELIKTKIGLKNIDYISATATAAIPQGAFIAWKMNLPMIYVRPSTKSYGKGGKVEGYLKKGSNVVIIEDHITTAASVSNNAQSVRELGGIVNYCITTTTYESSKSNEYLKNSKIKLLSLTTGKIIVETAYKKKILTKKQKEIVDLWFADPPGWALKMGFKD